MAKGLSGNTENFDDGRDRAGIQDISLAHAQQGIQAHIEEPRCRSWIPEPSRTGSSSSPSHTQRGKRKSKSKVLQKLDLNEREDRAQPRSLNFD
jgi:hypothetical protein